MFIASKFYCVKGESLKLKGVNYNNYSFDEIKKVFYNKGGTISFDNQLSFDRVDFELFEVRSIKNICLHGYDKRVFSTDMKETTPIVIDPD